jgi:DNA-binding transcriptional LysR family regulator
MALDLQGIDLALLPVLHDLLHTRSTTLTARRLRCTQSSVSHSLARLRKQFDDPLLVRVGRSLAPTRFAEELAPRLAVALGQVASLFQTAAAFSPTPLDRVFRFAGTDFSELLILPPLVRRLAAEAPGVDLVCSAVGADVERLLQEREVDLAFGTSFRERAGVVVKKVAVDELVLLLREGHPLAHGLDVASYVAAGHVLVAPRGTPGGAVDVALGSLDLARRVVVRVSNFMTAASLVAETNLVTAMPRSVAARMATRLPLVLRELPVQIPKFTFSLAWNEQLSRDAAHRWFRGAVEQVAAAAFTVATPEAPIAVNPLADEPRPSS